MNWNWKFRAVWILCLGVNDMSREMKDSGVEWIGEIPKNWNVQRVKNAFVRKKAEAHQENPVVLSLARAGVKVRDLSKNEGQIAESYYNYNLVEFGDLLLNPMDLYSGANCSISMVEGVISPAYINLRAKSGYSSRFYDYYFKTQYWSMAMFAHGKGVSFENRWTLGIEELFNYKIPVPLENEQDKIADFLDGQCEKINLAIEKAKVSIEEYRNLKQSFITQIVTKGINENDTMKESGIEWIGKIPASWKVTQLRHCASIRSGITLGKTYSKDTELVEMPYLRVANVQDGYVDTNDIAVLQVSKDEIEKYSLSAGEVLMTEGGDRDITQVVRMFDEDMHKEYLFLSYLIGLLPEEKEEPVDLDGKLKLEYYKLQKTFEGAITLDKIDGQYVSSKKQGVQGNRQKSTLDEILDKINEKYKGQFSEGDRVMLGALHDKLIEDDKLASSARTSDPRIFTESIFPSAFGNAAMESYMEAQDSYGSLFEDKSKYDAVMSALAGVIYREMRSKKTVDYRKVERDEQVQMVAEEPVKYGK